MHKRLAATTIALVVVLAGVTAALVAPATAGAATPCWKRVINQWLDNKPIATTYKPSCYQQALTHVPEDLRDYSDITDAISAALQASLRGGSGGGGTSGTAPGGSNGTSSGSGSNNPEGKNRSLQGVPSQSIYRRGLDSLGTTKADSLPIPLLVLAGLGTALLLTAAGLAAHKRLKARPRPPAA
ncbi:MAG TPA: hypothetical protein VLD16_01430 [Gaiellaceae bacterium]|nr:hypothetical protein [Gaiellaceae bacterium]